MMNATPGTMSSIRTRTGLAGYKIPHVRYIAIRRQMGLDRAYDADVAKRRKRKLDPMAHADPSVDPDDLPSPDWDPSEAIDARRVVSIMARMEDRLDRRAGVVVLADMRGEYLDQIGDRIGVSRERARQILADTYGRVRDEVQAPSRESQPPPQTDPVFFVDLADVARSRRLFAEHVASRGADSSGRGEVVR